MIERLRGDLGGWLLVAFDTLVFLAGAVLALFGPPAAEAVGLVAIVIAAAGVTAILTELRR